MEKEKEKKKEKDLIEKVHWQSERKGKKMKQMEEKELLDRGGALAVREETR
jgi:hypothetical protein